MMNYQNERSGIPELANRALEELKQQNYGRAQDFLTILCSKLNDDPLLSARELRSIPVHRLDLFGEEHS